MLRKREGGVGGGAVDGLENRIAAVQQAGEELTVERALRLPASAPVPAGYQPGGAARPLSDQEPRGVGAHLLGEALEQRLVRAVGVAMAARRVRGYREGSRF